MTILAAQLDDRELPVQAVTAMQELGRDASICGQAIDMAFMSGSRATIQDSARHLEKVQCWTLGAASLDNRDVYLCRIFPAAVVRDNGEDSFTRSIGRDELLGTRSFVPRFANAFDADAILR